jgi:hypothetical protein
MEDFMKKWLIKLAAPLLLWSSTAASAQNFPILNKGFSGAGIGLDLLKVIERKHASTCAEFTILTEA